MRFPILTLLLAPIVLLAGCAREEPADPPGVASITANDAGSATGNEAEAVAAGEAAAIALTRELMGRVSSAIAEGGPAFAIDFCSEEALPLTSALAEELGVRMKRTSSRVRNPENAPDADERAALAYFEEELEKGNTLPQHLVRQIDGETRYYRPIIVAELCTTCHGPRDALDPEVRDALDTRYPEDQATGYAAGDFRGLIRVSLPATNNR